MPEDKSRIAEVSDTHSDSAGNSQRPTEHSFVTQALRMIELYLEKEAKTLILLLMLMTLSTMTILNPDPYPLIKVMAIAVFALGACLILLTARKK
jgi:hypothetical protein